MPRRPTTTSVRPAKQPPFYRGEAPAVDRAGRLPVAVSLPPGTPASWLPVPALERLAGEMDAWLEGPQPGSLLVLEGLSPKATPPAVYLGCALDMTDECSQEDRGLPWLTSLDTPVWVLQVTGAVLDADGRILRSGAEGIWALRTPFRVSALGAQKLLTQEDVEHVRTERQRSDLPGAPLGWEAALGELSRQLLGGSG